MPNSQLCKIHLRRHRFFLIIYLLLLSAHKQLQKFNKGKKNFNMRDFAAGLSVLMVFIIEVFPQFQKRYNMNSLDFDCHSLTFFFISSVVCLGCGTDLALLCLVRIFFLLGKYNFIA